VGANCTVLNVHRQEMPARPSGEGWLKARWGVGKWPVEGMQLRAEVEQLG
jgi:hypothetical protein